MNLYNKNKKINFRAMDSYQDGELGKLVLNRKENDCFLIGFLNMGENNKKLIYVKLIGKYINHTDGFGWFKSDSVGIVKICIDEMAFTDCQCEAIENHVLSDELGNYMTPCSHYRWRKFLVSGSDEAEIGLALKNAAIYAFSEEKWQEFFSHYGSREDTNVKNLILIMPNVREFRKFRKSAKTYRQYF